MNIMRMKKTQILTLILLSLLCSATNVSAVSNSQDVDVEFTIENAIQITTSGSLAISDLLPGASGQSSAATVSVVTNSAGGYILSATVGNDSNATTNLANSNVSTAFAMVSDDVSGIANLSNNTWGISIDSGSTFISLPLYTSSAKTLKSDSSAAASSSLSLLIGAKAASSVESGTYANVINFTAVTQAPVVTLAGITTMQEMTSDICAATATPTVGGATAQYQLEDTRDHKLYWVAKLADGNCWMTQNLDYDLVAETTLTSADSNVSDDWTIDASTYTSTGTWNDSYDASESYDPGSQYLASGTASSGTAITCTSTSNGGENCHYHQGNYYNWYAATAGSNAEEMDDGDEAGNSICPKGWRLPYGTTASKSQYYLVNQASIAASNITTSPFYIPRAGYFNGSVYFVGSYGLYWSSTAYGDDFARDLYFDSSDVDPQYGSLAYGGLSVRCVSI